MIKHPYSNFLICKDNYFENPEKVNSLFEKQKFHRMTQYPGFRTDILYNSPDKETKDFAIEFIESLKDKVFPGITNYITSLHFHYYIVNEEKDLNAGLVHNDDGVLAGLVYLTPNESDSNSGTSIYNIKPNVVLVETEEETKSRVHFNETGIADETYRNFVKKNNEWFEETIKVGNKYNRLVAYDSSLYHCPTNYETKSGQIRKSLVFFIRSYEY